MSVSETAGNQIQALVEQLYENEGLTAALSDEAASLLLRWGEQQLKNLAHLRLSQADLDSAAQALRQAMRLANRLIEQRAGLTDVEMVEHLLKWVEQIIIITSIAQQAATPEGDDGQKETEQL